MQKKIVKKCHKLYCNAKLQQTVWIHSAQPTGTINMQITRNPGCNHNKTQFNNINDYIIKWLSYAFGHRIAL